ncbi:MAG: hypothetical protein JW807_17480 [Spirochaetes bacterium]|nr:hypothetical protein [Spirochaetota bacterium]
MKKIQILLIIPFVVIAAAAAHASGVDILSHQSAEFFGGLSRNASTDSADIVFYNPAGAAFMNDGLYLNASLQGIMSDYGNTYEWTRYSTTEPVFMPSLIVLYKKNRWAANLSFNASGGLGTVDYANGIGYIKNQIEITALLMNGLANSALGGVTPIPLLKQSFNASSAVFSLAAGGAYRINDMFSVALKARYLISRKSADLGFIGLIHYTQLTEGWVGCYSDINYLAIGNGIGADAGIDVRPIKQLTLSATFITPSYIKYDYSHYRNRAYCADSRSDLASLQAQGITNMAMLLLWVQGNAEKNYTDYVTPLVMLIGAEYKISDKFLVSTSWAIYFNSTADWNGLEHSFDTGWEASLGFQYNVTSAISIGLGLAYTSTGIGSGSLSEMSQAANPALDGVAIGAGVRYKQSDRLDLSFGIGINSYIKKSGSNGLITYDRFGLDLAVGAQYRVL